MAKKRQYKTKIENKNIASAHIIQEKNDVQDSQTNISEEKSTLLSGIIEKLPEKERFF